MYSWGNASQAFSMHARASALFSKNPFFEYSKAVFLTRSQILKSKPLRSGELAGHSTLGSFKIPFMTPTQYFSHFLV